MASLATTAAACSSLYEPCCPFEACPVFRVDAGGARGAGQLSFTFDGLPTGATAEVRLSGPEIGAPESLTINRSQTLTLGMGPWSVAADPVAVPDARVRDVFLPAVAAQKICIANGGSQSLRVEWSRVPTANRLWAIDTAAGAQGLAGFSSGDLASTGTAGAVVKATTPASRDLSFDREGNVWTIDPGPDGGSLVRLPATSLAASGAGQVDRRITVEGIGCAVGLVAFAFDPTGNLYLSSTCQDSVLRLSPYQLAVSGAVTPFVLASGIPGRSGLAFDNSGNLWVADSSARQVLRFDAAQLAAGAGGVPALRLSGRASDVPADPNLLAPVWLAFDSAGNLWATDPAANLLFQLPAAALTGTGERSISPAVRIWAGGGALAGSIAFDEGGGLWVGQGATRIARFAPSQLGTSSTAAAPTTPSTVVSSADLGAVGSVAIFPACAGSS